MRAISLWQPYASLIATGAKAIETRCWPSDYTGPLAIHAALKTNHELSELCKTEPFRSALIVGGFDPEKLRFGVPLGAIVATCKLVRSVPTPKIRISELTAAPWEFLDGLYYMRPDQEPFGDFSMGRFAWLLDDIKRVDPPIPFKGRQGWFEWHEKPAVMAGGRR